MKPVILIPVLPMILVDTRNTTNTHDTTATTACYYTTMHNVMMMYLPSEKV